MVQTYIKKRNKPDVPEEVIGEAVRAVMDRSLSLREAASKYGMTHTALYYRVKKEKKDLNKSRIFSSRYASRQVFSENQELMLRDYIVKCSKISYGMTYMQIRQLAYDYAKELGCKYPSTWDENNIAGIDWVQGFMKRHKKLALRKPENTSLARASAFNKPNVMEFYDNYEQALKSVSISADRVWNLDETGVSTVVQSPNVVAQVGVKQVGQVVSGERGTMITVCMIINAVGNSLPPVFVFPRARLADSLMFGAPPGSLGLVNSPRSSWMTGPLFLMVLEHVKKMARCSKEDPIILLMDNHESHCTLHSILYAREHGIVLVTFPPHCTHRLQPLDVGVMGPFKGKLRIAQHDWMTANPGKTITIHDLAALTNVAFQASFTVKNITAAFSKTGIWPFSRLAFSDEDFEPSCVTSEEIALSESSAPSRTTPGTPTGEFCEETQGLRKENLSPEDVRHFPKAGPSCEKKRRMKSKSRILTATPVKDCIEEKTVARAALKNKCGREIKKPSISQRSQKNPKKQLTFSSSSESDEDISVHDESDFETFEEIVGSPEKADSEKILSGDFLLIRFATKKHKVLFLCQVIEITDRLTYKVKFMRRYGETWKFLFPEIDDISEVETDDIVVKLPPPYTSGGTARSAALRTFGVNFNFCKDKVM